MNAQKIFRRSVQFLLLSALTFSALPSFGWNNVGHRIIAETAWRELDKNQRREISDLLKHHPHYQEYLIVDVPKNVDTNEWAFLKAAIWPDWIRTKEKSAEHITKYDIYPHALGLPFLKPGETNVALLKQFRINKPDSAEVLSNSMSALRNRTGTPEERAVSLAWVLHLMGDLHQPLHCASMVSEKRTKWDGLGGNYYVIDPRGKREKTDLHRFWDQLLGTQATYARFVEGAEKLRSDPQLKTSAMPEYRTNKTVRSWVEEGLRDATNFAYAPKHVEYAHIDDLKSGKLSESDIPVLKSDYIRESEKIARRRAALASQRLIDELKRDF